MCVCVIVREREHMGGVAEGEGEADSQLSREPDLGLHPRTLGSRPEPKAIQAPLQAPILENVHKKRACARPCSGSVPSSTTFLIRDFSACF